MHEVVRRHWAPYRDQLQLTRFPLDDGALVVAMRSGGAHPEWVAKQGTGVTGRKRVRTEKLALEWLAQWQERLRVPAFLDYCETSFECCLVQSGVPGAARRIGIGPGGMAPPEIFTAAEWLYELQDLVPPPVSADLRALASQWLRDFEARPDDWSPPLWAQVRSMPAPGLAAVPVHNDYWTGNLLFEGERLNVIDWSGFDAGSPLEDLLTLLLQTPGTDRGRLLPPQASFVRNFFSSAPVRDLLRAWARRRGLNPAGARFCFYLFLGRRLRWELGYSLQSRSEAEKARSHQFWRPILDWLAERNYPDPFQRSVPTD